MPLDPNDPWLPRLVGLRALIRAWAREWLADDRRLRRRTDVRARALAVREQCSRDLAELIGRYNQEGG